MTNTQNTRTSPLLIILAFATIYIVWGSTYYFISVGLQGFPPLLMGSLRFLTAGGLMLLWCRAKGDTIWNKQAILHATISGLLLLVIANGIVMWSEQTLPSSVAGIMAAAGPVWVVILDKASWKLNLRNRATVAGLITGFAGIILLFGESLMQSFNGSLPAAATGSIILLFMAPAAWSAGSLYSKKHTSTIPPRVNTTWQLLAAGIIFIPLSLLRHETAHFEPGTVPLRSWLALAYLVLMGSIAAYGAYIWLLQVRSAVQVSTHAYVNPVIAVLLGVWFGGEHISRLQLWGLAVILLGVFLVNLSKYGKLNIFAFKNLIWKPACK